jgi:serine/threonine protein phosphatase PrpC
VTSLALLALGLLLLCCLAAAVRAPAGTAAPALQSATAATGSPAIEPREPPRLDPSEAALSAATPDCESVTRLYGAASPGSTSDHAPGTSSAPSRPAACASTSRVVLSYEEEAEEEEATSPHALILLSAQGDSDRGRRRRANDDSLLLLPEYSLYAVADGMGGYAGGQVASILAVDTLKQAFEQKSFVGELRAPKPIPRRGWELASSILQANWAVFEAARARPELSKMGTTLVAARFSPNKQRVYIGHVGDSRCYRLRGGSLRQLTTDQIMSTIGLQGPRANDLLQAIGVTSDLAIDLIVDKPCAGDIYLLCSDGLPKMANSGEIQRILSEEPDLEAALYGLIELANDRGGKDNVTVVLIKVVEQVRAARAPKAVDLKAKGWSKLPDLALEESTGFEDVTVIGSAPFDDVTMIGAAPTANPAARPTVRPPNRS